MLALTITQPYASLIAIGIKKIETRSWKTNYRGLLAIHAGAGLKSVGGNTGFYQLLCQRFIGEALLDHGIRWATQLPRGAIVAIARLEAIVPAIALVEGMTYWSTPACRPYASNWGNDRVLGDYSGSRYAWLLTDVRRLPIPIPVRGKQRLWSVPEEIERELC